ncbi:MAG: metallophosphoesterase [Negativicutes bacterium]|nr:metallophosphoesterase [Negativicutes bacterium]
MGKQFIVFFSIFLAVYGSANYYIGLRFWQSLNSFAVVNRVPFWAIYILLAATPAISRWATTYIKGFVSVKLSLISAYWLGITFYGFFLWLLVDMFKFAGAVLGFLSASLVEDRGFWGMTVLTLLIFLIVWGSYNAQRPVIKRYTISLAKRAGHMNKLRAVLVADTHLGPIIGKRRLEKMVGMINKINPEIIFFAGDTIDEDVPFFVERHMPEILRKLKPRLGSYAVLGNHEYLGGHADSAVYALEQSGITVLRDNLVKVKDCLYIAGRDDPTVKQMTGQPRPMLRSILSEVDPLLPLILIDHQPYDLNTAKVLGVDLLLAGHTHKGQFFPNNFITSKVFEVDWGYLKKGSLQIIVTCGFGTWGPPIRIGNRPELVEIDILFDEIEVK